MAMANPLRILGRAAPPRSPERVALAAAIDRHNSAVTNLAATTKAIADAGSGRIAAEQLVVAAKETVEAAKRNAVTHLTARMLGEVNDAPTSVRDARDALRSAEDEYAASREVETALQSRLKDCEENIYWAKRKLTDAICDVVKSEPGIRALLTRFSKLRHELAQLHLDLTWFAGQFMIPDEFKHWESIETMIVPDPNDLSERTMPWAAALSELASNSEAPLPAN
jgi:uncharacterized protein YPO0396